MGKKRAALEEIRSIIGAMNEAARKGEMSREKIKAAKKVLNEKLELLRIKDLPFGSFFTDAPVDGKPYTNEHACRLQNPDDFERFARKNCYRRVANKCLDFIFGIKSNKSKIQAYRYKIKTWDVKSARAHCKKAGGRFEAAKSEED